MLLHIPTLLSGAYIAPTVPQTNMPEPEELEVLEKLEVLEGSRASTILPIRQAEPSPPAPLLSLPNELLLQIAESAPRADLVNLSMVSKRMNTIGSEILYQDVPFTSSEDDRLRMAKLIYVLNRYPDLANLVKSVTYMDLRSQKDPSIHPRNRDPDQWRDLEEVGLEIGQALLDVAMSAKLPFDWVFCTWTFSSAKGPYGYSQTNSWIKAIRIGSRDAVLAALLSMVPNISKLKVHFAQHESTRWASALAQAAILATRTPWVFDETEGLCEPLRQTFSKLKEVDVFGPQYLNHDLSDSSWMSLPSVKHIRRAGFRRDEMYMPIAISNADIDLSGIQILRLSDNGDASMSRGFGKALSTCKKLCALHISESGTLNRRFIQALKTQNRSLETLVIDGRKKSGGTIRQTQRPIGSLASFRYLKYLEIATAMLWGHDFSVEDLPELLPRCLEELVVTDLWANANWKMAEIRVRQILESVRAGHLPVLRKFTIRHPPNDEVLLVEDIQELEFAGSLKQKKLAAGFHDVHVDFQVIRPA
ncbi:uncharacterized protein BDZ99DRAFT_187498 [Mytilinidion resinicola]|uniref:F-box domain-containing protein n=1 Tax=Mytilinidion resinicola TaxID=574789 RepID=A0A6A6Z2A4_9PEZI|nr:uncharacterized protein BDZ99DRAFT_187498 [Mytilinidion resinicola]KAF2814938.1 hypothetical protein BDZ99DRAFT_187498 [Mytilinidion resinicola]